MKMQRLAVVVLVALVLALRWSPADAIERTTFNAEAFAAAQRENRPILIEVHAWWCPVCWMQKSAMGEIDKSPRFKNMISFTLDYDKDKAVLRQFNVQKQSTMVVFKGAKEVGRLVGESDTGALTKLLARAY